MRRMLLIVRDGTLAGLLLGGVVALSVWLTLPSTERDVTPPIAQIGIGTTSTDGGILQPIQSKWTMDLTEAGCTVIVEHGGRITLEGCADLDEASRVFWDAMQRTVPICKEPDR